MAPDTGQDWQDRDPRRRSVNETDEERERRERLAHKVVWAANLLGLLLLLAVFLRLDGIL